jgi:hypothetical protein
MSEESPLLILAMCSRRLIDELGQPIALLNIAEERRQIEARVARAGNLA